jgi:hypothetical protein
MSKGALAMPGTPRQDIFDSEKVGIYHAYTRCTQRALLCGVDPLTGNDYSHRKEWIRDRLKELTSAMAVDVLDYAVMDNHLHTVIRNRPDVVNGWSDEEVVRRWWQLCPKRRDANGLAAEPSPIELNMMLSDPDQVHEYRRRLSDISWFMRLLCQPIARRANKESNVTGRFFAHRFGCGRILDECGLLACSMYVDLNPIRAGKAASPETSEYTSALDRIRGGWQRTERELGGCAQPVPPEHDQDAWLAPVFLDERAADGGVEGQPATSLADGPVAPHQGNPFGSPRPSNKGFLPMSLEEYLSLLDWTGRQLRSDKRGAIPRHLAPILERLRLDSERWIDTVRDFGRLFRTAVGRSESVWEQASRMGRRWLQGVHNCAAAFG